MLDTSLFGAALKKEGFDFYSGVPCSFLKDLINYAVNEAEYVMAANEGDGAAVCAGAWLGGRRPVLLMQNSGLGNAVSPLTSLNAVFRIPVLGFVSLRGEAGLGDEPQHELMGLITGKMLEVMDIEWAFLSPDMDTALAQLAGASKYLREGKPFFYVVKKGTFSKVALKDDKKPPAFTDRPCRMDMLRALKEGGGEDAVYLATTGFTGRELYELGDDPNNLYMVGSLGCVSSLGLGLSLARPDKKIIVIDGDGSILMRTGSLGVNSYYKPASLLHVLLDNRCHETTGGQFTVSAGVNYPLLATAFGYPRSITVQSPEELKEESAAWKRDGGLLFIHAPIRTGSPEHLARPLVKPPQVASRLRSFLGVTQ
ncbi:MAG: phosphonopyruvate decarboxylase [Spirochaetaceae bacterium]|jgi:phosphonopyruvate decarboxylase|nr:phosphonopyruvate decarboxylase [Spirochaetaceae bacterium]